MNDSSHQPKKRRILLFRCFSFAADSACDGVFLEQFSFRFSSPSRCFDFSHSSSSRLMQIETRKRASHFPGKTNYLNEFRINLSFFLFSRTKIRAAEKWTRFHFFFVLFSSPFSSWDCRSIYLFRCENVTVNGVFLVSCFVIVSEKFSSAIILSVSRRTTQTTDEIKTIIAMLCDFKYEFFSFSWNLLFL